MSDHRKSRKSNHPSFFSSPLKPQTLTLTLIALVVLTFILLTIFSFSHSFLPPSSPSSLSSTLNPKIYLYNTPRLFTFGVVENYLLSRNQSPSRPRYPGHQHSAEWHLFSDLLNPDRSSSSPLRRVADPRQADLFFVPFFSSLSVVVNPIRPNSSDGASYNDEEMQEEVVSWVERQEFWRRNKGRDHVFVCQDPNAMYKVIDRIKNGVLLVSDFGRLGGDRASLVKDVILPYSHRINAFRGDVGIEGRNSLLFFMGNRYRKEVSFLVVEDSLENCFYAA